MFVKKIQQKIRHYMAICVSTPTVDRVVFRAIIRENDATFPLNRFRKRVYTAHFVITSFCQSFLS